MNTLSIQKKGFTIVELLIVIVVIAILAAISIVAYNGIQNRSENAKTVSAVSTWAKALQMYKLDRGDYPGLNSCLGGSQTYTDSYSARCWAPENNGTWVVQPAFLSEMSDYIKSYPEPSNKNIHTSTDQYKGALFYRYTSTDIRVYAQFVGVTSCPDISGLDVSFGNIARSNGVSCYYRLP